MTRAREVVIAGGARTPRGKGSPKGRLHGLSPLELVTPLLSALGVPGERVDDVVLGCATPIDEQGANVARTAALLVGWERASGAVVSRFCASGLDAVANTAARVASGELELAVAGGVESVSRVPMFSDRGPLYADPAIGARVGAVHMGVAADLIATLDGVSREALDDYAEASRAKARAAPRSPALRPTAGLDHDELLDGAPDRAALAQLPPAFADRPDEAARALARHPMRSSLRHLHTRGSSPALADAAAALVVGERAAVERAGLVPRARVVSTAVAAADPVIMLTAGQEALERALARAGLAARDLATVSFAEAFAATCLRLMRTLELDHDRLNPHGGTIALGHAFGATGVILTLEVLEVLERRGAHLGAAAVSGAAGVGSALVVERIA